MNIAIVKYNAGNIYSVVNAMRRLGIEPVVTDQPDEINSADGVLFPGQGEASFTMRYLQQHRLNELICSLKQPVLGICIGMQLMCKHSQEGDTECMGIFDAEVKRFTTTTHSFKIPHMGWNSLTGIKSPLYKGIEDGEYVYFIHSYYVPSTPHSIANSDYIQPFCASMQRDNFYATQFHPEKSGRIGEQILKNFLDLCK